MSSLITIQSWTHFTYHSLEASLVPSSCPIRFGLYRFDYGTGEIAPRGIVSWLKNKTAQSS